MTPTPFGDIISHSAMINREFARYEVEEAILGNWWILPDSGQPDIWGHTAVAIAKDLALRGIASPDEILPIVRKGIFDSITPSQISLGAPQFFGHLKESGATVGFFSQGNRQFQGLKIDQTRIEEWIAWHTSRNPLVERYIYPTNKTDHFVDVLLTTERRGMKYCTYFDDLEGNLGNAGQNFNEAQRSGIIGNDVTLSLVLIGKQGFSNNFGYQFQFLENVRLFTRPVLRDCYDITEPNENSIYLFDIDDTALEETSGDNPRIQRQIDETYAGMKTL